jgi:GNAT superfamily N-acetyltransferase
MAREPGDRAVERIGLWRVDELSPSRISRDVADGLFFLGMCDGRAVGTVKFQFSDPEFWPDLPDDEAAFIHRLAVRREFAGGVVSSALLQWAVERAGSLGRRFLRRLRGVTTQAAKRVRAVWVPAPQ